jgi:ankyrin repeat protein
MEESEPPAEPVPLDAPLTEEDMLEVLEFARYGELEDLELYLSAPNASVDFVRPVDGSTALHMAAANGHAAVAAALLARGARMLPNHAGNTPLLQASGRGHTGTALSLINDLCARVGATDSSL